MAKKPSLRWVRESEERVESHVERFRGSLRRIAVRFAHHGRADSIDAVHVDEAFEAIVRFGLKRQPWWKRSELKITLGAVFVGAAVGCPDLVPVFLENPEKQNAMSMAIVTTCGFLGGGFYLWGWFQNKL